jgi:two-component system KDP operon response regulator KdpE
MRNSGREPIYRPATKRQKGFAGNDLRDTWFKTTPSFNTLMQPLAKQRTNDLGCPQTSLERPKGRILIVDDDYALQRVLHNTFAAAGYDVAAAASGEGALSLERIGRHDIVLLSLRIPGMIGMSGMEICRELRRQSPRLAILIVTVSDTDDEMIAALDAGADDYIAKPFQMRELMARVRAEGRRVKALTGPGVAPLRAGEIELNPMSRLVYKAKKQVHLTPKEFDLLDYLMAHTGMLIDHGQLLYLRTFVRQLRKKLEEDAGAPMHILTRSYFGYRFVADSTKT